MGLWQIIFILVGILFTIAAYCIAIAISFFSLRLTYKIYKNSSTILKLESEFDSKKIDEINRMLLEFENFKNEFNHNDPHSDKNISEGYKKMNKDITKDISEYE